MSEFRSYRDLEVWQLGVELASVCYTLTRSFPREEVFGLTSQIRRAAASIPANIAEGHGRESTGDFVRFLQIAQGSLKELETHLIVCVRVGVSMDSATTDAMKRTDQLGRMIRSLIRSLQERQS